MVIITEASQAFQYGCLRDTKPANLLVTILLGQVHNCLPVVYKGYKEAVVLQLIFVEDENGRWYEERYAQSLLE
jgi:hypothetical protein